MATAVSEVACPQIGFWPDACQDEAVTRNHPRRGVYAGRSAEQRQAERRRKLIEAAFDIWGEQGWAAVTMRGVCARAELTDRYFYENFADRDALLGAVWEEHSADTTQRLLEVVMAAPDDPLAKLNAAIDRLVRDIVDDPRLARIGFGDHAGNAVLERLRHDTIGQFTDLLIELATPYLKPDVDHTDLHMSVLLGIGGFAELVSAWLAGTVTASADRIIAHTTTVGAELAVRYLDRS